MVAIEPADFDNTFRLVFGKVLEIASNKPIKVAEIYDSHLSSKWNMVKGVGFEIVIVTEITATKKREVDAQ